MFHKPFKQYTTKDYFVLVPLKYQALKDDIPYHYLNNKKRENGETYTMPDGFKYDVPLSLNAEVCLSQFRNKEVKKPVVNLPESTELDDSLFTAQIEAKKGIIKV